jgi:gamma-glutamyltranspeptidase / glutathione hydrolase
MPRYAHAVVAADHALASQAGLEVLQAGGNAVDAAVATSFALSVVRPYSCGLGGGGFMLVRMAGRDGNPRLSTCFDYRESCPAAVDAEFFARDPDPFAASRGARAVAVPGHVAGMLHALDRLGALPREQVLAPAMRLAREGFLVDAHYLASAREVIAWLDADRSRAPRFGFLCERFLRHGAIALGDRITLPEQAEALGLIARDGLAAWTHGPIADAMIAAVRSDPQGGGVLTHADLATYQVKERAPIATSFLGHTVLGAPPPSSGGVAVAQTLALLEARRQDLCRVALAEVGGGDGDSPGWVHLVSEAMQHAFADRARWLADADVVDVPLGQMLDAARLRARALKLDLSRTQEPSRYGVAPPPREDAGTSHLCVVDGYGNAVSCTETINLEFGSLVCVPEFGFAMNGTMDDFAARAQPNAYGLAQSRRNAPAPGKRALSCMTPTIVLDHAGVPTLVVGGAGGPRIITGVIQVMLNALVRGLGAEAAVAHPRFHHQWQPAELQLEESLRGGPLEAALRAMGHVTSRRQPIATVQAILARGGEGGGDGSGWDAASDPRKGGIPAGW